VNCLSISKGKSLSDGISQVLGEGMAGLLDILVEEFLSLLTNGVVDKLILSLLGRGLIHVRPSQLRIQVDRDPL
jgi:hypothetical protein